MKKLEKMATGTVVVACDARKALVLRNTGPALKPRLVTEKVMEAADHGAAEYADRPGRRPDQTGAGKGPRSAMEQPDVGRQAAERFAGEVIAALAAMHAGSACKGLVSAAPAGVLGHRRRHLPADLRSLVTAEFAKDLTPLPVDKLTAAIFET